MSPADKAMVHLKFLRMPTMRDLLEDSAAAAAEKGWSHLRWLEDLLEAEVQGRMQRRTTRLLKQSGLPLDKTRETLKLNALPKAVQRQVSTLWDGAFIQKKKNILLFGPPGVGKTHLAAAIAHALVIEGIKVLFASAAIIVQRLLHAKNECRLEALLNKWDAFELIVIDDIGYVQQSKQEMEVLFTLLAHRYERRSIAVTSNLVFRQWDKIFVDPMTTAAAIDRLVHHAIIIQIEGESYRKKHALKNMNQTQI